MDAETQRSAKTAPRSPEEVMRLSRMGAFHQSRLSFMRVLTRRMQREGWRVTRRAFEIDARGIGHAVYAAEGPERAYSLVAFAHDLPPEKRSDRVIAEEWDATFALFDGVPEARDIARLAANVPLQEAGRVSASELSLSRANRSVRLWDHVVESLAAGRQPDPARVAEVGYLMRTTAVYGSGKFGAADREAVADRPELAAPFQAEMLSVYLTRAFVLDLVEHMARARAPATAVPLDRDLRRSFGIGNSTGLGMAPFLVNHPMLLNNWIAAREEALARVRSLRSAAPARVAVFREMLARAIANAAAWRSDHPAQVEKLSALRADLDRLAAHCRTPDLDRDFPWDRLWRWAEAALTPEGQEQLVSLLLEPHGDLVDDLADCMSAEEGAGQRIDGAMPASRLAAILQEVYGWALAIDWSDPAADARAWYVSEEKLEPRLGERHEEDIAPWEQPLAPGRDAARLAADLARWPGPDRVADVLLAHPEHRHIVRRAQIAARLPYAEIRDNTIGAGMLPIDMLRAKLSFFGATHFDPRSDRWVRINMFRGAPLPDEIATGDADTWAYPPLPGAET